MAAIGLQAPELAVLPPPGMSICKSLEETGVWKLNHARSRPRFIRFPQCGQNAVRQLTTKLHAPNAPETIRIKVRDQRSKSGYAWRSATHSYGNPRLSLRLPIHPVGQLRAPSVNVTILPGGTRAENRCGSQIDLVPAASALAITPKPDWVPQPSLSASRYGARTASRLVEENMLWCRRDYVLDAQDNRQTYRRCRARHMARLALRKNRSGSPRGFVG